MSFPQARFTTQKILVPSLSLEYWGYLADSRPRKTALTIFLIDSK